MNTPITKKDFLSDVMHEINALRQFSTEKEKKRLNMLTFNPKSEYNCIYGQLTTDCASVRAKELMGLCCIRTTDFTTTTKFPSSSNESILEYAINGSFTNKGWSTKYTYTRDYYYLSVLEIYIMMIKFNTSLLNNILEYIKKEIPVLTLELDLE